MIVNINYMREENILIIHDLLKSRVWQQLLIVESFQSIAISLASPPFGNTMHFTLFYVAFLGHFATCKRIKIFVIL